MTYANEEVEDKESLERELNEAFPGYEITIYLDKAKAHYVARKNAGDPWFVVMPKHQWDACGWGLYRFAQFATGFEEYKQAQAAKEAKP